MTPPSDFIDAELARFRDELFGFLQIPSISARSEHDSDTRSAAEWLAEELEEVGLEAEIHETDRHPVVLGEWRGGGGGAPTVLVYGHYDVQPPEPLEEWSSPPFEPEVRGGRIYGRGTADDKGQLFMHLKALEAHLRGGEGRLPVNVVVLAEGEEEIGSPHLLPFVERHRNRLACDVVVISDSAMFAPGTPSLLFSLRGLAYVQLDVRGPRTDLHSGSYGGAVPNPASALGRIVGSLHDEEGRIAVPGFYDRVVDWDEEIRERIAALPFDEGEYRDALGLSALGGEEAYTPLERLWIRPTCDVNGLLSGYTGEGAKTVLPARAMAKVSFRLVPDQEPARILDLLEEHVRRVAPPGIEVELTRLHGGRPWRAELGGPAFEAASRALERAFGRPPVLTGEGGSIPIVVEFEEILGAPCLLVGFALPGANMHAPDEWLAVENFEQGIHALAALYEELGQESEGASGAG